MAGRGARAAVEGARMAARGFWLVGRVSTASCEGEERCQHPALPTPAGWHPWLGGHGDPLPCAPPPRRPCPAGASGSARFTDKFCFPSRLQSQTDRLVYLPRASTSLYKIRLRAYQTHTEAESSPCLAAAHQLAPFPVKPKLVQLGGQREPSTARNTARGGKQKGETLIFLVLWPRTEGMKSQHLRTDHVNQQQKANVLSAANNSQRRKQRGNYHCSAALRAGHPLPVCFG